MKATRGIEVHGFRAELSLQTRDGDSHSLASDNAELISELLDRLAALAKGQIEIILQLLPKGTR